MAYTTTVQALHRKKQVVVFKSYLCKARVHGSTMHTQLLLKLKPDALRLLQLNKLTVNKHKPSSTAELSGNIAQPNKQD